MTIDHPSKRLFFQSDIVTIKDTLQAWCDSCDGMLACLESQVNKANTAKQSHIAHKKKIEQKVSYLGLGTV